METNGGDGSETGSVTKKKEKKNQRPVWVPASPRTTGIKRRVRTTYLPLTEADGLDHSLYCTVNVS